MLLKTNKKLKINRKSTRLQIKPQDIFVSTNFFVCALFVRPIYSVTCFSLAVGLYLLTFYVTERELKKKKIEVPSLQRFKTRTLFQRYLR